MTTRFCKAILRLRPTNMLTVSRIAALWRACGAGAPSWVWLFASLVVCTFARPAQAQDTSYLKEMPAPQKVLSELKGGDKLDSSAKQAGAMYQLRGLIWDLAGPRQFQNRLTSEENRLVSQYMAQYGAITSAVTRGFDPKDVGPLSTRAKWFGARTRYETSPDFRAELLQRFFSPAFRARVLALEPHAPSLGGAAANPSGQAAAPFGSLEPRTDGVLAAAWARVEEYMGWLIALVVLGILVMSVGYAVQSYNQLHARLEPVKKSRSGIKIAIDRRCTAVNDLVQLAQHFSQTEKLVYLQVSQDSSSRGMAAAYQQSAAVLSNVQHLAERFPNLKSNEHFIRIMDSVQHCEVDIQRHRHYSNELVQHYNTFLQQFPRVLIAKLIGFGREEYVDLDVSQARQTAAPMQLRDDDSRRLDHVLGVPAAAPQQPAQFAAPSAPPQLMGAGSVAARGGGTSVVQALPNVSLRFLAGPLNGRSVPIGAGAIVGREAPAQVVVPDPQVSSAHAWIGMGQTGLIFMDRGSTNGSSINGTPVPAGREVPIKGGDVISLGRTNSVSFVVDQA